MEHLKLGRKPRAPFKVNRLRLKHYIFGEPIDEMHDIPNGASSKVCSWSSHELKKALFRSPPGSFF